MHPRHLFVSAAGLLVGLLLVTDASAIIRRHDVADSQYVIEASDYPGVVDLLAPGDCVATLIAPRWLITAAHCATNLNANATLTVAGVSYAVSATQIPSSWNDDTDDIALVQLAEPVEGVTPIPIYRGEDEQDQLVWFVGRGDTNTGLEGQSGAAVDGQTRKASNRIVDADQWWISFVFNSPDDAEVTDLEGISGDGDSGGPALLETAEATWVVGLSSYQDEGNHALGTYGVEEFYTRVSRYADWIDSFVPAAPAPRPDTPDTTDDDASQATDDDLGPDEPSAPEDEEGAEGQDEEKPESWYVMVGPGFGAANHDKAE